MQAQINNLEIHYEISGNENGPWLVLLHGLSASTRTWKYQLDDFNKHFHILNIDLPGHGQSGKLDTNLYNATVTAHYINQLLDTLNIEKAYFLGISLGTIIEQFFCEMYPEKVIAALYGGPVTKSSRFATIFNHIIDKLVVKLFSKNTYLKLMSVLILPGKIHEKSRKFFLQESYKMDNNEFLKWWNVLIHQNSYDYISVSSLPALIIVGEKDTFFYQDAISLQSKYLNAKLETIRDSGHVTSIQKPQEFNKIVIEYIKENQKNVNSDEKIKIA